MIECVPAVSAVVVNVAVGVVADALNVPVPITVAPSKKVTEPTGVPVTPATEAVNVIEDPRFELRLLEVSVVVVFTGEPSSVSADSAMSWCPAVVGCRSSQNR